MPDPSPNNAAFTEQANRLELEKRHLENEKLRAELRHESLAWWKRPGYIGGLTPVVLAVIGFASAWGTGFFDRQRANLKSEVENLQSQKEILEAHNQQLTRSNADIQATIDEAYLSLKLAVANAIYAFGHLGATGPSLSAAERQSVESARAVLPAEAAELVQRLLDADGTAAAIIPITKEELQALNQTLEDIPASAWARELQPEIGPVPMLRRPDGKVYDPARKSFHSTWEEFETR
jgi:hypothetical protein